MREDAIGQYAKLSDDGRAEVRAIFEGWDRKMTPAEWQVHYELGEAFGHPELAERHPVVADLLSDFEAIRGFLIKASKAKGLSVAQRTVALELAVTAGYLV